MKWANSLALVASAFFDLVDAVVLLIGIWGHVVTKNRANFMHSYGFERFEIIVRFATSCYFLFVCLWVFFEGIEVREKRQ
jgi:cation diffusion facilitator family transporter